MKTFQVITILKGFGGSALSHIRHQFSTSEDAEKKVAETNQRITEILKLPIFAPGPDGTLQPLMSVSQFLGEFGVQGWFCAQGECEVRESLLTMPAEKKIILTGN